MKITYNKMKLCKKIMGKEKIKNDDTTILLKNLQREKIKTLSKKSLF